MPSGLHLDHPAPARPGFERRPLGSSAVSLRLRSRSPPKPLARPLRRPPSPDAELGRQRIARLDHLHHHAARLSGVGTSNIAWWKLGSNFSPSGRQFGDAVALHGLVQLALGHFDAVEEGLERRILLRGVRAPRRWRAGCCRRCREPRARNSRSRTWPCLPSRAPCACAHSPVRRSRASAALPGRECAPRRASLTGLASPQTSA